MAVKVTVTLEFSSRALPTTPGEVIYHIPGGLMKLEFSEEEVPENEHPEATND